MNLIFSLDLSIRNSAVGYYNDGLVRTTSFPTKASIVVPARLHTIVSGVFDFIYDITLDHEGMSTILIFLENYAFNSNNAIRAAEVGGAIKFKIHDWFAGRAEFIYISPKTLKKFTTGSGQANKVQMDRAVCKRWGAECENEDECDAYALAQFGGAFCNGGDLTKKEMETIKIVYQSKENVGNEKYCFYRELFDV